MISDQCHAWPRVWWNENVSFQFFLFIPNIYENYNSVRAFHYTSTYTQNALHNKPLKSWKPFSLFCRISMAIGTIVRRNNGDNNTSVSLNHFRFPSIGFVRDSNRISSLNNCCSSQGNLRSPIRALGYPHHIYFPILLNFSCSISKVYWHQSLHNKCADTHVI